MGAEAAPLPSLPRPPERVDRYDIIAEVAHGGMAAVFAARRSDGSGFDKLLAIKLLLPHLAKETRFIDMFRDEARIAAYIQHPNVVQVFDVGDYEGLPFMVMEYLKGQSLAAVSRQARDAGTALQPDFIVAVLALVAEGLHSAHESRDAEGELLGVVHRDISPQNVHVGYDGQVKVVDFGIAAARGRMVATRTGEVKGKLSYLAPEQIHREHPIGRRTDLWALGVMGWELLAGRRLFREDTDAATMWNIMHKDAPDLAEQVPQCEGAVADCLMQCLRRDPNDRPRDAAEVASVLSAATMSDAPWTAARIAEHVRALFPEERVREEERLASALRENTPPPLRREDSGSGRAQVGVPGEETTVPAGPPPEARRRRARRNGLWLAAAAASVAVAGAIAWGGSGSGDAEPPDASPPPVAGAPEQGESRRNDPGAEPAEPEPGSDDAVPAEAAGQAADGSSEQAIALEIGRHIERVVVEGEVHDERPVRLRLSPDEEVRVVLHNGGRTQKRRIRAEHDGSRLRWLWPPRREGAGSAERRRGSGDGPDDEGDDSLLSSPY